MNKLGKQWEVLQPHWQKKLITPAVGSVLCLGAVILIPIGGIQALAGVGIAVSSWFILKAFQFKNSGITFHDHGIRLRLPGKAEKQIVREQIEHFEWEGEDIVEDSGASRDHIQKIHFSLSWTDEKGEFQEVDWEEEFPPGSIARLQRAFQRPALNPPGSPPSVQSDDYWDE